MRVSVALHRRNIAAERSGEVTPHDSGGELRIEDHGTLIRPTREELEYSLKQQGIDYEVKINDNWVVVGVAPYEITQAMLKI